MEPVVRLVTFVDIDDGPGAGDACSMSLSAVLLAILGDGRRMTLLSDRGWSASGPADIWHRTSIEEVEETARVVVGPDEPFDRHSQADMETDHWDYLAGILRQQGMAIDGEELRKLPQDVELTERLRRRLTGA